MRDNKPKHIFSKLNVLTNQKQDNQKLQTVSTIICVWTLVTFILLIFRAFMFLSQLNNRSTSCFFI